MRSRSIVETGLSAPDPFRNLDPKVRASFATMAPDERIEALFRSDFEELLKQPTFRRWLMHIVDSPEWAGAAGTASELDAHPSMDGVRIALATYRRIGAQDIGRRLLKRAMEVSRDMYSRMTAEAEDLFALISNKG